MTMFDSPLSRRDALKVGVLAGTGLALGRLPLSASDSTRRGLTFAQDILTRPIPSTGERIPIIGLGTNQYGVTEAADIAVRRDVIERMLELGGTVVDTARSYGRSEIVIGEILKELGTRDQVFLASKCTAPQNNAEAGLTQLREAFERLQTDRIDLMMIHNLNGTEVLLPILREWKQEGKLRYIGISTSNENQYQALAQFMRNDALDVIQIDYSIGNRSAAELIFPLAQERGLGVMLNVPFGGRGGRNLFGQVSGQPLPAWAAEIGAETWGQYFLKFNLSHPAVTVAIPGTTQVRNIEDNMAALRGPLPDEALRRRMQEHWDSLG